MQYIKLIYVSIICNTYSIPSQFSLQHLVPEVMSQQHISSLLVTLCDIQSAEKTRFPQVLSYSIRLTLSPASVSLDVTFIFPMVTRHTKTAKTPSWQGNCAFNNCNEITRTQRCSKNFIHFTRHVFNKFGMDWA